MKVVLAIDGGGSTLRAALVAFNTTGGPLTLHEERRGTVNPSLIGREAAAALIHEAIAPLIAASPGPIAAVGIGVAGASPVYADAWLRSVVGAVLPGVPVATGTDIEIALVGAHGRRHGLIVAAGTGSVALAIVEDGPAAQAGGWGYLLGDEGSGYWIGCEGLRHVTAWEDAPDRQDAFLAQVIMAAIDVPQPRQVIGWVYRGGPPDVKAIAALAPVVLSVAEAGNEAALAIVDRAAHHLAALAASARHKAGADHLPIAFGGSLLTAKNPLSRALAQALGLPALPSARHSPVVGAALLAQCAFGL